MTMNIEQRTKAAVEKIEFNAERIEQAVTDISGRFVGDYVEGLKLVNRYDYTISGGQSYKVRIDVSLPFVCSGDISADQHSLYPYDNAAVAKKAEEVAVNAADNAQSAADAAAASGKIYSTIAKGIAATTNGELFLVVSDKASGFSDLYLNDNGTGVYQSKTTISLNAVTEIREDLTDVTDSFSSNSGTIHPIATNISGDLLMGYDSSNQTTLLAGVNIGNTDIFNGKITGNLETRTVYDARFDVSSDDVYPIACNTSGDVILGYSQKTKKIVGAGFSKPTLTTIREAKHNHILGYGQSLAVGMTGAPALSLTSKYGNLTFSGGTCAGNIDSGTTGYLPFVGLTESVPWSSGATNETHCSGTCNYLSYLQQQKGVNQVLIGSTAGIGATSIDSLMNQNGTGVKQLRNHIKNAYDADNDYVLSAVTWLQGENDVEMPAMEYAKKLDELQMMLTAIYQEITTKTNEVYLVTYQLSYGNKERNTGKSAKNDISQAYVIACKRNPYIALSTPMYIFNYHDMMRIHIDNVGYKHVGCYNATAIDRILTINDTCLPIDPLSAELINSKQLNVAFSVRYKPLRLANDFGFAIMNLDDGSLIELADVKVLGESIIITAVDDIPENSVVRYALDYKGNSTIGNFITGNMGTGDLVDSYTNNVTINNKELSLTNVAPNFELPIFKKDI